MPTTSASWQAATGGLLEAAPDAMVVIDESGLIHLVNAQTLAVFGYQREELLGQSVEILIPESIRTIHEKHREEYVHEPRLRSMGSGLDLKARRSDGSEFPVEISLSPLETDQGLLISAAIRDITRQRREQRLFRGLLEAAPDAMVIVDGNGLIVLVNAQVERLFGYDREELLGQAVEKLVPERFLTHHEDYRQGYVDEPRTRPIGLTGDLFARRADGSEFPVEISLAPLETDEGLLISAAVRDITERKRIQERADHIKDEFFATVSHELRTPLTSLIGYGELLSDLEQLSPRGQRFLSVMLRGAERELRLVDDLLTIASIQDSGLAIRKRDVDLERVTRESVEAARPPAQVHEQTITLTTAGVPIAMLGDADRLGQALDNLLSNAIKFTPSGGSIRVEIAESAGEACIQVSDDGPGLSDTEVAQVFDRMYRADSAVRGQVPGAGLGLTVARAVVEAHSGTLSVVRSDASGTVFQILLPLNEQSA